VARRSTSSSGRRIRSRSSPTASARRRCSASRSSTIGKKGQNVRLAAKLTGWRIDIKSEEEKRREVEAQFGDLEIPGESADEGALSAEAGAEGAAAEDAGESAEDAGESADADATEAPLPYTLAGIGDKTIRKLVEGGFATLESLGSATAEVLAELPGIGEKTAEKILAAVRPKSDATNEAGEEQPEV
jgi:N utilization substance protein A